MSPSQRITIRLSPVLAAKLAATMGPHGNLADTVRHAIEVYLEGEPRIRQPRQTPVAAAADTTATTAATTAASLAATLAGMADTLAAIQTRLAAIEQRVEALEAADTYGNQRQPPGQPPQGTPSPQILGLYDPHAAAVRSRDLRQQGLSYTLIAVQLTREGIPTRYGKPWEHSSVRYVYETYGRQDNAP